MKVKLFGKSEIITVDHATIIEKWLEAPIKSLLWRSDKNVHFFQAKVRNINNQINKKKYIK